MALCEAGEKGWEAPEHSLLSHHQGGRAGQGRGQTQMKTEYLPVFSNNEGGPFDNSELLTLVLKVQRKGRFVLASSAPPIQVYCTDVVGPAEWRFAKDALRLCVLIDKADR
ncbi:hypothetical protein MPTK1_5g07160 [Marchantia polymorpha subsp. ruderalis]|uniref:Uncharacterized protein n=2 Tax=Marchantia polymorpha TaxID=3197 RepID=A0AAF6BFU0_MARPO|nr:hypothetical protein MARPO_0136s0005 [Marchantia polymorpha]BBN10874.1 hypothetical protein Mp_5g07160 [Marchantia polymorpha subsp. ruderalis]|eukprot:PTQ29676.1 hypothetical protein MARPO_0136s0005 [Marchantia polymorpha]